MTDASRSALLKTIDMLNTPVTLLDLTGRIVHINPANERFLGHTTDALRGKPISAILPAELRERSARLLESLVETGKLAGVFPNVRSDGSIVPVEVSAEVVRSSDGQPRWILASVRDLGEHVEQLEQLNASALALLTASGDDLLVTVVQVARRLVRAKYAALGIVEGGRLARFIPDGLSEDEVGAIARWPEGRGLLGQMIAEVRTIRLADIAADPRSVGFPAGHPQMRSFLGTPIRTADEVFGHLYFADKLNADEFSFVDERLAELFASHVAIAIRDRRQRDALEASERLLADSQRIAGIGSGAWDMATDELTWTAEALSLFGRSAEQVANMAGFLELVHPDDRRRVETAMRETLKDDRTFLIRHRIVRGDGEVRVLSSQAEVVRDQAGRALRMVGTVRDITEQASADVERARLAEATEQTADSVMITDTHGKIEYVNTAFERLSGYSRAEVLGETPRILKSGRHDAEFYHSMWGALKAGRTWSGLLINRSRSGRLYTLDAAISPVRSANGKATNFVEVGRDVTREIELETTLARQARELASIEAALGRITPSGNAEDAAASICAELVRFPGVESAAILHFGSAETTTPLAVAGLPGSPVAVGRPLPRGRSRYLRDRARLGPWVAPWEARPEDGEYGERMTELGVTATANVPLRDGELAMGVLVVGTTDAAGAQTMLDLLPSLLRLASLASAVIRPGLRDRQDLVELRQRVETVIAGAAFVPVFQPVVNLRSGVPAGYEALTRFADGSRPDLFIALAHEAGTGGPLEIACIAAAVRASRSLPARRWLSVNVSPRVLTSNRRLAAVLRGADRPVVIEVTEHAAIEDYRGVSRALHRLSPRPRLAVDDAGAGYASLRHILELRPAFVKLDIGIVRGIDADPARQAMVKAMHYYARSTKAAVIAEGIETEAEAGALRRLGVRLGQGYLFSRPRPAEELTGTWGAGG